MKTLEKISEWCCEFLGLIVPVVFMAGLLVLIVGLCTAVLKEVFA